MKKILLILCIMAISVGVFADGGTTPQFRYEDMTEGQFWVIDEDGISVNTETFPDVEVGTLNFTDATELTIATGEVTITQSVHTIDGETDADDDLVTISGGVEGDFLILYPENAARNITLINSTGNILTSNGLDTVIPDDGMAMLYYNGTNWLAFISIGADITISGDITVGGNISINEGGELRWYDTGSSHYTGFEAPALTANQIYVLPDADGTSNQVMKTNGSGIITWQDDETGTLQLSQGVAWDQANDTYARLGSIAGIATSESAGNDNLPIQSDMKRCLLQDDGTVNYYIDSTDPIMKDGTTVISSGTADTDTANKLIDSGADFVTDSVVAGMYAHNTTDDTYSIITAVDNLHNLSLERDVFPDGDEDYNIGTANFGGADGQVMVEIPKFYYKQYKAGDIFYFYHSKYDLAGFELHPAFWKDGQEVDYRYYSAFEGGMWDDSEGAMCAKASIPSSIYASPDKMTSVAGTWAKVNEQRSEYRTMAAQRGTGFRQLDYYLHSAVQLLYLVEYADFDSQVMIGAGRTNLTGGGWTADSNIGLTGLSVGDGNGTNSVMSGTLYDVDGTGYATDYMTYRGIENLYGNVWKMLDGITWDGRWTGSAAAQPVYTTNNSAYFQDAARVNMQHLCDASYIGGNADYIGNLENVTGFIPSAGGGSATTEICDYYYQYSEVGRDYWRVVLVGGHAYDGSTAGAFSLFVYRAFSSAHVSFSARLCF